MMNKKTKELRVINNEVEKELTTENRHIFTDMIVYMQSFAISDYQLQVIRQDLIGMIVSAQQREENIQALIGENYKAFCEEVVEAVQKRSKRDRILSALDTLIISIGALLCVKLVFTCLQELLNVVMSKASFHPFITIKTEDIFTFFLLLFLVNGIVYYVCKHAFEITNRNKLKYCIGGCLYIGILLIFVAILQNSGIHLNVQIPMLLYVLCIVVLWGMDRLVTRLLD